MCTKPYEKSRRGEGDCYAWMKEQSGVSFYSIYWKATHIYTLCLSFSLSPSLPPSLSPSLPLSLPPSLPPSSLSSLFLFHTFLKIIVFISHLVFITLKRMDEFFEKFKSKQSPGEALEQQRYEEAMKMSQEENDAEVERFVPKCRCTDMGHIKCVSSFLSLCTSVPIAILAHTQLESLSLCSCIWLSHPLVLQSQVSLCRAA